MDINKYNNEWFFKLSDLGKYVDVNDVKIIIKKKRRLDWKKIKRNINQVMKMNRGLNQSSWNEIHTWGNKNYDKDIFKI